MTFKVQDIPVDQIKFFLRRSRAVMPYDRLKQSIAEVGLKTPIGVRDISDRPKEERRRQKDGGLYQYELVYGQGRLQAFRELGYKTIPASVLEVSEEEIVGRFLAENVMRRRLSYKEKAQLIRKDVEDNKLGVQEIAKKYYLSNTQASRYLRILSRASAKVREMTESGDLSAADAEELVKLNPSEQDVVIEVLDEQQLDRSAIKHLVDEAAKLRSQGPLDKQGLRAGIDALNRELKSVRDRYRLKRAEYALGPARLKRLAADASFRTLAERHGIELAQFAD